MQRPDFDNMTEKEARQFGAWVNWVNGTEYEAQQRRKRVSESRIKEELEITEGEEK